MCEYLFVISYLESLSFTKLLFNFRKTKWKQKYEDYDGDTYLQAVWYEEATMALKGWLNYHAPYIVVHL